VWEQSSGERGQIVDQMSPSSRHWRPPPEPPGAITAVVSPKFEYVALRSLRSTAPTQSACSRTERKPHRGKLSFPPATTTILPRR
jgi:hypothetical protein